MCADTDIATLISGVHYSPLKRNPDFSRTFTTILIHGIDLKIYTRIQFTIIQYQKQKSKTQSLTLSKKPLLLLPTAESFHPGLSGKPHPVSGVGMPKKYRNINQRFA